MELKKKLVAIEASDLVRKELPPRELILDPWLENQSLCMIYAKRGVGKTQVSLGIAYAVANGGSFLCWNAPVPREVLFVDGEMSASDLKNRLTQLNVMYGTEKTKKPLNIITPDLQDHGTPDISTREGQSQIEEHITPETALIILDNIATLSKSGDENDADDWQPIQEWFLRLRAQGLSVLFIHHAGKNGEQRGTSAREDALNIVIHLQESNDHRPEDGASFTVRFTKTRHLTGDAIKSFNASLVTKEDGITEWKISGGPIDIDTKIRKLKDSGKNQSEIARELNVDRSTISRRIRQIVQSEKSSLGSPSA